MIPKGKLEDVIKKLLIIQWSKDTKEVIRGSKSKGRQYNDQKIPKR